MNIGGIIRGASESVSGLMRGYGARKAGSKESRGYKRALGVYQRMESMAPEMQAAIDPFSRYRGEAAQRLYDITLGGGDFTTDPGYQFRLEEGRRETERAASARGLGTSGSVLAALQERGQQQASQEYQNVVSRMMELGGGFASVGVAGGQARMQMTQAALEGQAASHLGRGFAQARRDAAYYEAQAQANAAAGRGVASIWEMPGQGGGGSQVPQGAAGAMGGYMRGGTHGMQMGEFMGGGTSGAGGAGVFDMFNQMGSMGGMGGGTGSLSMLS